MTRVSVSIPSGLIKQIEERRGDVSRSRAITRLLEAALAAADKK